MDIDTDLNKLKNQIEHFDKDKQLHIFQILKEKHVKFSENRNGIFINMSELNKDVLDEIRKYVQYVQKQEITIDEIELKQQIIGKTLESYENVV